MAEETPDEVPGKTLGEVPGEASDGVPRELAAEVSAGSDGMPDVAGGSLEDEVPRELAAEVSAGSDGMPDAAGGSLEDEVPRELAAEVSAGSDGMPDVAGGSLQDEVPRELAVEAAVRPGETLYAMDDVFDDDDDLWPLFSGRLPGRRPTGPPGREQPGREQHINERIQHRRDRAGDTPRRASLLSRREIVAAAIKVADAEGSGAISMRRIARELNAGAMSLYWHVASKDELLDLMLDAVEAEQEFLPPTGDWRTDLRAMALAQRAVLHRHQWLMDFIGGRPPLGPNTLRNLERALTVIDKLELDFETALNVLGTIATYVMGAVLREFRENRVERRDEEALGRLTEAELREVMSAHVDRLRATGRFPHFLRIYDEGIDPDSAETRDARFEFGLDCVLDGIAARLP